MLKSLPVNELKVGMFVVAINDDQPLTVKQQGFVESQLTIATMQRKGVHKVTVDLARQKQTKVEQANQPCADTPQPEPKQPLSERVAKKRVLIDEAKNLQTRLMQDVKLGHTIDVAPVEQMASGFIDAVADDPEAMACLALIKNKDDYLLEHSIGVAILMNIFAQYCGFGGKELHQMATGSLLHDLGKVMIPEEILNKPGRLTDHEFNIMKSHAAHGQTIMLRQPQISKIVRDVVSMHHEKLDGSGYPLGLKGDKISVHGRMIAICDIYDALTADRVYKKGMPPTKALKILLSMAPDQLDEELVQKFIKCIGVYPPGAMVELSNGRLAIIVSANKKTPVKPVVKLIYHINGQHHLEPTEVDLSRDAKDLKIVRSVDPKAFGLELDNYL
ncbi:HD-GYP domain-containing protein [Paraferrimonas sedimenticola]|uniref:Phosphodiesterase n=1 Tax=Paraferrimonas sedimenticola TaxID=375674 RepID=A0AA37RZ11_9GAMM|nr:HD-GYP domain-containing protein [Paraferrimonas sedimenticola]GLP97816.1 phosphodiesterase [Paraferrimonas sedimenticola]